MVGLAEAGERIGLSRHGHVVAEVVGADEIARLREDRESHREVELLLTRVATDTGAHSSVDEVMAEFGITRDEVEAEIAAGKHELPANEATSS